MPHSDLQLARMGLKRLADIPNRVGFKFIGRTRDGRSVECVVGLEQGLHKVLIDPSAGVTFSDLTAWAPAK